MQDPVATSAEPPHPPPRGRRFLRWLLWVVLVLGIGWVAVQCLPPRGVVPGTNPFRARSDDRPLNIAHRGGRVLFPENTREAFAGAVALGCDCLEMDVRLTRDGVLATCHDAEIDRTSNGHGRVRDHTLAELQALNFGAHFTNAAGARPYADRPAHVATLEELFQQHTNTAMIIELKDRGADGVEAAEKLARMIERFARQPTVLVASFDEATLASFRAAARGQVRTSGSPPRVRAFALLNLLRLDWFAPAGDAALQLPLASSGLSLDGPRLLGAAHRRNLAVHYWTINDPAEMRRLASLGADGLITDRPDLFNSVFTQRAQSEGAEANQPR
jgi:glycerophosphoryl diester phosphodiesterase